MFLLKYRNLVISNIFSDFFLNESHNLNNCNIFLIQISKIYSLNYESFFIETNYVIVLE